MQVRRKEITIDWQVERHPHSKTIKGDVLFNGKKIGYVSATRPIFLSHLFPDKDTVEIINFHPFSLLDYDKNLQNKLQDVKRREGIGTTVHSLLEEKIKEEFPNVQKLLVLISPIDEPPEHFNLKAALKFYKSQGYKLHKKIKEWAYGRGIDYPLLSVQYVMVKHLDKKPLLKRLKQILKP